MQCWSSSSSTTATSLPSVLRQVMDAVAGNIWHTPKQVVPIHPAVLLIELKITGFSCSFVCPIRTNSGWRRDGTEVASVGNYSFGQPGQPDWSPLIPVGIRLSAVINYTVIMELWSGGRSVAPFELWDVGGAIHFPVETSSSNNHFQHAKNAL